MPRLPRLPSIPFGWYYVALHAENGRTLVRSGADLNVIGEVLRETVRQKGAHLHAGSVMPNEVHLAIQNGENPVSAFTRSFCREYARRFNRRHDESGGLFRPHPHVLLIQHQVWLVPLAHVIHWMPRLRSFKSVLADCWCSSDSVYRVRARRGGLTTHVIFHIVSGGARHRNLQDEAYRRRFDQPPDPEHLRLFVQGSPEDPRMLGDSDFVTEMWRTTRQRAPRHHNRAALVNDDIRRAVIDVIERFAIMCDETLPQKRASAWKRVATLEHLCSHLRKRPLPMLRAVSASYVIQQHIATRAQTAQFFGCRPETISSRRRRHQEALFGELFPDRYLIDAARVRMVDAGPYKRGHSDGREESPWDKGSEQQADRGLFESSNRIRSRGGKR
jgi:putative transposase